MRDPFIARVLGEIDPQRIRRDVCYLAHNPLPMRKLNLTVPDHAKSTLEEADDYLTQRLEACNYAGYGKAVVSVGSFPYADPEYHREGDIPERVNYENVKMTAQASLAAVLHVDQSA